MNNKNLPVKVLPLTEQTSNIVSYSIKNSSGAQIYCEGVTVVNGFVTMTNLRIQKDFKTKKDAIQCVGFSKTDAYIYLQNNSVEHSISGYKTLANRTVPQQCIDLIDSYGTEEQEQLPLWARTSEEEALKESARKAEEERNKILRSNGRKYCLIVKCAFENYLLKKYLAIPGWRRKIFRIKKHEWIEEERQNPASEKILKEIVQGVCDAYIQKDVEYTGKLEYHKGVAEDLYDRHVGNNNNVDAPYLLGE